MNACVSILGVVWQEKEMQVRTRLLKSVLRMSLING